MSLRQEDVFAPRHRRGKPELAVQKAIIAYLLDKKCLVAVTDAGAAYRAGAFFGQAIPKGWPDITGLLANGKFIGVECKAPGGKQSPAQARMEREIRMRGGIYVLARCVEDLKKAIENAD